ncbi:MAG TPA: peptidylprolyl isomerase, partial [Candidatus Eisenbacteria bacterium]|nr:peptidylprolyl isomerase [Candidatus Eisenbacteria bacterium]
MRFASPVPFERHLAGVGRRLILLLTLALAVLVLGALAPRAMAAIPPSARGPIATIGKRTVEAQDIQRAAQVMYNDPLRVRSPAQWRRKLLDRCVDRELLSMEAERLGLPDDPVVRKRFQDREYFRLYRELHERVLVPGIEPTQAQLDSLRKTGLYRSLDLYYIVMFDDERGTQKEVAQKILDRIRAGASFDSMAFTYSAHPSRLQKGHFGPTLVRDLAPASYKDVNAAKPGDVLGLYSGRPGRTTYHQIYKIGGFTELSDDSLRNLVRTERSNNLIRLHEEELLTKYHFTVDPATEKALLFTLGSEARDSILASLSPDGTRPERGVRPALGILARVDGDSLTFLDFHNRTRLMVGPTGRLRVQDALHLRDILGRAFYQSLAVRDAKERGFASEPKTARELRLMRDQEAVLAMVGRARPPDPKPDALRAYFESHASEYQRPAAWVARVGMFQSRDSAQAALRDWNGTDASDSAFVARGLGEQPRAT